MKLVSTIVSATVAIVLTGAALVAQSGNDLFQRALVIEKTASYAEAIALYQTVVDKHASDKKLLAKALFQMGQAYEKLGKPDDARKAYERIVKQFPREKAAVEEASRRLAVLQGPKQREGRVDLVATVRNDLIYWRPSPDGRYLVRARGAGVFLYDTMLDVERQLIPDRASFPIFTPDGRRVVYARFEGGRGEIRSINIDGSDVKTLYATTQYSQMELSAVSRDGKRIAVGLVLRDGGGSPGPNERRAPFWQIGLVTIGTGDTGDLTVLKSLGWRDTYSGNFSPDGKWLVYSAQVSEERNDGDLGKLGIFTIAVDGSADHTLVGRPMAAGAPFFTPDGFQVVFLSGFDIAGSALPQKTLYAVWVADGSSHGAAPEGIRSNISSGMWSAWLMGFSRDGSLYYDEVQSKFLISAADLEPGTWKLKGTPLAISDPFRNRLPASAAWSPDGRKLAYVEEGSVPVLVIKDLQSGDERTYSSGPVRMTFLGWTPDGSVLLDGPPQGLRLVDLETRRERPVPLQTPSPMLSWDGKSILYLADQQPSAQGAAPDAVRTVQVKRHDLETGSEEVLRSMTVQGPLRRRIFALSPDGRFVALIFAEPGEKEALRVVPLDGGPARVLPSVVPTAGRVAFTPDGSGVLFMQSNEVWVHPLNGGEAYATGLRLSGLTGITLNPEGNRVALYSAETIRQVWAYRNLVP